VTAVHETVTTRSVAGATHTVETVAGGEGAGLAWDSPWLPEPSAAAQVVAEAGTAQSRHAAVSTAANSGASGLGANTRGPRSRRCLLAVFPLSGQLVQLSVAGDVVAVPAPPVAVTPVKEGMEK